MKSGLQLGNGPVFSLGFGAYNTQTTAFGFSTTTNTWAFSNNGNNMNVSVSYTHLTLPTILRV